MDSRLSSVAGEMERLSLDLTQAAKNKRIWDCLEFVYGLRVRVWLAGYGLPKHEGSISPANFHGQLPDY